MTYKGYTITADVHRYDEWDVGAAGDVTDFLGSYGSEPVEAYVVKTEQGTRVFSSIDFDACKAFVDEQDAKLKEMLR